MDGSVKLTADTGSPSIAPQSQARAGHKGLLWNDDWSGLLDQIAEVLINRFLRMVVLRTSRVPPNE